MAGNTPASLPALGTSDGMRDYCRKLIDSVAGDWGYVMSAGASMDDAHPANVKAMFEFTREYGVH